MRPAWFRILPLFSFLSSVYIITAIILINVGGVNYGQSTIGEKWVNAKNTRLGILKWKYRATPAESDHPLSGATINYATDIYLNRICSASGNTRSRCANKRFNTVGTVEVKNAVWISETARRLSDFDFTKLDLRSPFALYIIAAISSFVMMSCSFISAAKGYKKGTGKLIRLIGLMSAIATWLFLLAASALVQKLALRLRNQLNKSPSFTQFTGSYEERGLWRVRVTEVELGRTVLVLTWVGVALMCLNLSVWTQLVVAGNTAEGNGAWGWRKKADGGDAQMVKNERGSSV